MPRRQPTLTELLVSGEFKARFHPHLLELQQLPAAAPAHFTPESWAKIRHEQACFQVSEDEAEKRTHASRIEKLTAQTAAAVDAKRPTIDTLSQIQMPNRRKILQFACERGLVDHDMSPEERHAVVDGLISDFEEWAAEWREAWLSRIGRLADHTDDRPGEEIPPPPAVDVRTTIWLS